MRSSLILGVTILTIAVTSIVQAQPLSKTKSENGNLGSGTNACKCKEIVVKAAKTQKPLVYASPQAINEAAIAREAVGRYTVGTGSGIASNVISSPYSSGIVSTSSSSSSSSSSLSSSSSSSSSVGIFGRSYSPFNTFSDDTSSNSGCGCGKKSESDLFDNNKQIVPSFPPIGDLCYPSKVQNNKITTSAIITKVKPAYPSKLYSSPAPSAEEVCVQLFNGKIDEAGAKKLGLTTTYGGTSATSDGFFGSSRGNAFGSASNLGEYISNNAGSLGGYSSFGSIAQYAKPLAYNLGGLKSYGSSSNVGYSGSSSIGGYGSTGYSAYGSGSDVEVIENYESNYDDSELPKDYSYPRLPADPVSLTLAYKNLFSPNVIYNKKMRFVPEDKLSFGHRTIPHETASSKKKLDVPEEKLQILDKPIVELKSKTPSVPMTVQVYNEQEEVKLAELEAIERERINQEEVAEQQQGHLITYGDLGYAPINGALPGKLSSSLKNSVDTLETEDDGGCGPVGPPAFDYVPGTVMINRMITDEVEDDIQTEEDYEHSDEEDDEDTSSGIFARLRSSAQKYGLPCGAV